MKRILILLALGLVAVFVAGGCSGEGEAKVACAGGCGMEIAEADATEIDGKFYCAGCAAKVHEQMEEAQAMVTCAGGCGKEMAKADAKEIDGKYYCAGCAAKLVQGDEPVEAH